MKKRSCCCPPIFKHTDLNASHSFNTLSSCQDQNPRPPHLIAAFSEQHQISSALIISTMGWLCPYTRTGTVCELRRLFPNSAIFSSELPKSSCPIILQHDKVRHRVFTTQNIYKERIWSMSTGYFYGLAPSTAGDCLIFPSTLQKYLA